MKRNPHSTDTPPKPFRLRRKRPSQGRERGIAIVTVLAVLLLMSVLVVAFMSMAANEYTAANNYDYSIRSRQASDAAISMVIGQIRKATTQGDIEGTTRRFTWASQPGAITTFSDNRSGYQKYEDVATIKYKLYSSDRMEEPGDTQLAQDVPEDWDEQPARYVDLNEPIFRMQESSDGSLGTGDLIFPIVDPRGFDGVVDDGVAINRSGPLGFGYTNESSVGNRIPGVVLGAPEDQRLPMPVMWLYMLEDGTIGHLNEGGSFIESFGDGTPSPANPIAYRFAFWTDDESVKVNVNTASEAAYWDLPLTTSNDDRDFAAMPPVMNELNRFPGHPATTSLSPILFPEEEAGNSRMNLLREQITQITPKVAWGGTQGGTQRGNSQVTLDNDRLYASVDEILYQPRAGERPKNDALASEIDQRNLDRSRFLLTTSSRAPEVTLFGTPRLCLWPMHESQGSLNQNRTEHDNLIAYCTTIPSRGPNSRKYFFQRRSNGSRHQEFYNRAGGANVRLRDQYLVPHTDRQYPIPGFGGSFASKYGSGQFGDRIQICTEIMDFIRGVNLYDPFVSNPYTDTQAGSRWGQIAGICGCGGSQDHTTRWHNEALRFPKGFGRMATVSEIGLVFITTALKPADANAPAEGDPRNQDGLMPGQMRVEAALVFETFSPSHGFTPHIQETKLRIMSGDSRLTAGSHESDPAPDDRAPDGGLRIQSVSTDPPSAGRIPDVLMRPGGAGGINANSTFQGKRVWGGNLGVRPFLNRSTPVTWQGPQGKNGDIILPSNAIQMRMEELKLRVVLYDSNSGGVGNLIQVFDVTFPSQLLPVPRYSTPQTDTWKERVDASFRSATGYRQLFMGGGQEVVRSMVVSHGDYRMVSAKRVVVNERTRSGANHFQQHPDTAPQRPLAHSFIGSDGQPLEGATFGTLINGTNYPNSAQPDFPMDPSDPDYNTLIDRGDYAHGDWYDYMDPSVGGDFNNGLSVAADGAYLNRADDGNSQTGAYYTGLDRVNSQRNRTFFTPNRLISGPGMLGSLSTGVQSHIPWRTLLFRPDPKHFGSVGPNWNAASGRVNSNIYEPPDHLWMDLLWMPIVQPFAISEPFSTMGKINMNYQIAPFDYIKRASGMHAIFRGEKIIAIPDGSNHKGSGAGGDYRHEIDADETLKQFEHRFEDGEIFRSATEICEIYLVPKGKTLGRPNMDRRTGLRDYPSMRSYWAQHRPTGDNSKERPYAGMYPRLTTKSNTYKVHMVVQNLKKARSSDANTFEPEKDRVTGQWRGSALIERNIDPNDESIPNYIDDDGPSKVSLDHFYNYRVLNVKQFAP